MHCLRNKSAARWLSTPLSGTLFTFGYTQFFTNSLDSAFILVSCAILLAFGGYKKNVKFSTPLVYFLSFIAPLSSSFIRASGSLPSGPISNSATFSTVWLWIVFLILAIVVSRDANKMEKKDEQCDSFHSPETLWNILLCASGSILVLSIASFVLDEIMVGIGLVLSIVAVSVSRYFFLNAIFLVCIAVFGALAAILICIRLSKVVPKKRVLDFLQPENTSVFTTPFEELLLPTPGLNEVALPTLGLDEVALPTLGLDDVALPTPLVELQSPGLDEVSILARRMLLPLAGPPTNRVLALHSFGLLETVLLVLVAITLAFSSSEKTPKKKRKRGAAFQEQQRQYWDIPPTNNRIYEEPSNMPETTDPPNEQITEEALPEVYDVPTTESFEDLPRQESPEETENSTSDFSNPPQTYEKHPPNPPRRQSAGPAADNIIFSHDYEPVFEDLPSVADNTYRIPTLIGTLKRETLYNSPKATGNATIGIEFPSPFPFQSTRNCLSDGFPSPNPSYRPSFFSPQMAITFGGFNRKAVVHRTVIGGEAVTSDSADNIFQNLSSDEADLSLEVGSYTTSDDNDIEVVFQTEY